MKKRKKMNRTRLVGLFLAVIISAPAILIMNSEETNSAQAFELPPALGGLHFLVECWKVADVLIVLGSPEWLYLFCFHGCLNKGLDPQTDEFWECVEQCKLKYLTGIAGDSDCGC